MKTILITGATGGLGIEVTKHFLKCGYNVIATTTSDKKKHIIPAHAHLTTEAIDLTNAFEVQQWIAGCISKHGKIDAALLLAGGFAMGDLKNTSVENLEAQMNINFKTAFNILQPLWLHMQENDRGRIVMVGSRTALEPHRAANMIAYSLSKSLLFQLSEYVNANSKHVKSFVLVPDTIDTPANRQSMPDADHGKWHTPAQIIEAIETLLHDADPKEFVVKLY